MRGKHVLALLLGGLLAFSLAARAEQKLVWGSAYELQPSPIIFPKQQGNLLLAYLSFDPLFRYNQQGRLQAHLIEKWRRVSHTVYEFTLRDGIYFHSGNPLTTADIDWTYRQLSTAGYTKGENVHVTELRVLDRLTFEVETKRPFPALVHRLSYFFPSDSRYITRGEKNAQAPENLLISGTGPFILDEYLPGIEVNFAANPYYWAPRQGNVSELDIIPVAKTQARLAAIFSRDVDLIDHLLPDNASLMAKDPELTLLPTNGLDWFALEFHQQHPALSNVLVRHAINLAVNNELLAKEMGGFTQAASQLSMPGYTGYNTDLPARYNPLLAHQLLEQAGIKPGLRLELLVEDGAYAQQQLLLELLVGMLERVNIQLSTRVLAAPQFYQALARCEGDLVLRARHSHNRDVLDFATSMMKGSSSSFYPGSHCVEYANDDALRLIDAANQEMDASIRERLIQRLEKQFHQDSVLVPLFWQQRLWAVNQRHVELGAWLNNQAPFPYFEDVVLSPKEPCTRQEP